MTTTAHEPTVAAVPAPVTPAAAGGAEVTQDEHIEALSTYRFGVADPAAYAEGATRGLSEKVVADISALKGEPEWMLSAASRA